MPERSAIAEEDQELAADLLEELRTSLVDRIGLGPSGRQTGEATVSHEGANGSDIGLGSDNEDSAVDGIIATVRRRWSHISTARRRQLLQALTSNSTIDDPFLRDLRFIDTKNEVILTQLEGVLKRQHADVLRTLTWCVVVLQVESSPGS